MKLQVEYLSKDELKPYANNAKIHTAEQVEQIKNSIREFGFNDPIAVWHDNEIIEGHGRLLAAMEMEDVKEIPVIRLDDLSDEQRRAYMLVHNKLTMNTDFDVDLLSVELEDIIEIDMSNYGFEENIEEIFEEDRADEIVNGYEKGEVLFTEYIDEVSQYVVLKFKTKSDWEFAKNVFGLTKVKQYSTRKDGKENGMQSMGLGRVIDGMDGIKSIENNYRAMYSNNGAE